jgi:WD40 repeat protein
VDNSNNVFVTGFSAGANGYDGRYGTVAYSTAGVPLWTNLYNGPRDGIGRDDGIGNAIAVDSNGNVFVTGESWNGDSSLYDYATIKYSSAGVPLWTRRYGVGAFITDVARAIAVDSAGNVFVTGSSDGINATVAYSNSGTLLWTKLYTSENPYNDATGIAVDRYGNVFVTGNSPDGWITIKYSSSIPPPTLALTPDGSGGYFIRFEGVPGSTYRLQRALSVTGPWTTSAPQTADSSGLIVFHDLFPPPSRAFYRAVQQ